MIDKLIDEMNCALDNGMYLSALMIALMLPDICGKAEYPDLKGDKSRYTKWYSKYIGKHYISPFDNDMPCLNATVIYDLRCSLLHSGNPNLESKDFIDHFNLIVEEKNEFDIYSDTMIRDRFNPYDGKSNVRTYNMSIRRFCLIMSLIVKDYYDENKSKFDFFNYSIVDKEHERFD